MDLLLSLLSFFASFLSLLAVAPNCLSSTRAVFTFPITPLSSLNPYLPSSRPYQALLAQGCPSTRPSTAVCPDIPAVGSGLAQLAPRFFLGLTDQGPNQNCDDLFNADPVRFSAAAGKDGKAFPVPGFSPTLAYFRLDASSREIIPVRFVHLRDTGGRRVSGLPNTQRDDIPYGPDCRRRLPYDQSGVDPEDVAPIPGTDYVAIVEEYSPSVLVVHRQNGRIAARYVPISLKSELGEARYPIVGVLPDVYLNRRKNRGFEGIVVDAEGKYVIAIMQSPMLGEDEEETENNAIIRCVVLDVVKERVPRLRYTSSFVIEASEPGAYIDPSNRPKDMKYSAAQYAAPGKFVALERANGQVKLFLVDFSAATNIDETVFADNLGLEVGTNGLRKVRQLGIIPAEKTLIWDSAPGVGGSVAFDGSFRQEGFAIDMIDPSKMWLINDNEFGLGTEQSATLRYVSLGRNVTGATVCGVPSHPPAPAINLEPTKDIRLTNPLTFRVSNEPGAGAAEAFDLDERARRAYVANGASGDVDMYDVSTSPVTYIASYINGEGFEPTSTSVCKKRNAVAIGYASTEGDDVPGRIDIIAKDLRKIRTIRSHECFLVDHVKWSEDCNFLVGACEGEGADVPGGILVADFGGPVGKRFRGVRVASFKAYDRISSTLTSNGIRLVESITPSLDLEPEYITIVGKHAFVTLQENNAIAVVDLYEAKVTELKPIGSIEHKRRGFALDASDKDGKINIRNYDFLYSMPQPDTISMYVGDDGETYLVYANEGDAKDSEEARGEDLTDPDGLGRNVVPGLKQLVDDPSLLGRLQLSTIMGYNSTTNMQEKMFHFGSRSFSIMALNGTVVFDSGEWFARIQEEFFPEIFNANGFDFDDLSATQEDLFDNRSDDKGMEPESLSIMQKRGRTYAFIGFESSSIIVVFDITKPSAPTFVDAAQNHPTNIAADKLFAEGRQGDLDPEGLFASSILNKLFVAGSASNTISTYDIEVY